MADDGTGTRSVLLMEPSFLRRRMLREELARRGWRVLCVRSPEEAGGRLARDRPDLVVAYLDFSDHPQLESVEVLRESCRFGSIPIILYSPTLKTDLATLRDRSPLAVRLLVEVVDLHALLGVVERHGGEGRGAVGPGPRSVRTDTPLPVAVHRPSSAPGGAQAPRPSTSPGRGDPLASQVGRAAAPHVDDEVAGIQALLAEDPWSPDLLEALAARLYARQRFSELEPVCRKLLALGRQAARHWFYLGDALYRAKQIEDAVLAWEEVLRLFPGDEHAPKAERRVQVARRVLQAEERTAADFLASDTPSEPPGRGGRGPF